MKVIIDRLYVKIDKLISRFSDLENQNINLSEQLAENRQILETKNKYIEDLEEKNRILKISTSLNQSKDGDKSSKKKINELVREIDKCIALLNK